MEDEFYIRRGWSNRITYPFDSMVDVSLRLTLWCVPHFPSAKAELKKKRATTTRPCCCCRCCHHLTISRAIVIVIIIYTIVTFYQKIISFFNSLHTSFLSCHRHIWFFNSKFTLVAYFKGHSSYMLTRSPIHLCAQQLFKHGVAPLLFILSIFKWKKKIHLKKCEQCLANATSIK